MKIIVADDHPLTRAGLVQVLTAIGPHVECIEAVDQSGVATAMQTHPDAALALVDLNMPGMKGAASIEALTRQAPTVPVVVVSASDQPQDIRRAMEAGAAGYIPKSESTTTLLDALRLVLGGGTYAPLTMMNAPTPPATDAITPRQIEVLSRIAAGQSNKEISRGLGLSEATVKAHVAALFKALGVHSRTQAVHVAQASGLLSTRTDSANP
ncbi:MAG: response regulator transcription factor [Gammaproteobacteria bacterium]|nr:response regulator transcription factor [Gammaproteobacteria bacterium]